MKRKLLRIAVGVIFVGAFALYGCEFLQDCGECVLMTDDGTDVTAGTPLIFCGDELATKQSSSAETIGGITTWWDCDGSYQ